MKNLSLVLTLLTSFSASAIINDVPNSQKTACDPTSGPHGFICIPLTTTSLPTLMIESHEMKLDSTEGSARLIQEAYDSSSEKIAIKAMAEYLQVNTEELTITIKTLFEAGEIVNVETITNNL